MSKTFEEKIIDENIHSPINNQNIKHEFLANDGNNFNEFIKKLQCAHEYIQDKNVLGAKFPIDSFCYDDILRDSAMPPEGRTSNEVFKKFANILDGAFRPQSQSSVFNMVPTPLFDATAAATLMQIYNNNCIMDSYGGKSILYEQQVARSIGRLIGWENAYGISCNGGKLTLYYAIKSAILKIDVNSPQKGIPNDLVILTAEGAHYSLEHTCSMLGLGADKCIRIPRNSTDGISSQALKQTFIQQIKNKKRVAAIICCGGTTLDFVSDHTQLIYSAVKEIVDQYKLDYFPYLHLDSVIGWLWFTFLNKSDDEIQALTNHQNITRKISIVINKFKDVKNFDSVAVDMHKNGLCPYSSSFFIARNRNIITGNVENEGKKKLSYGNIKAFEYTLENSRPSTGVASAWVALQRLGISGYRKYLIELMSSSEKIKQALKHKNIFTIMNESSLGWEIIFSISFTALKIKLGHAYDANLISESFMHYIWHEIEKGKTLPNFSIIKNFRKDIKQDAGHGFIIYCMQVGLDNKSARKMVSQISKAVHQFEREILNGKLTLIKVSLEAPIR